MGGGGAPAPPMGGGDGESEDLVSQIKMYLQQEGINPKVINNLDAFLAEAGGKGGNQPPQAAAPPNGGGGGAQATLSMKPRQTWLCRTVVGMEPRGSEETNLEAEDEENCAPSEDEVIPSSQEDVDGEDEDDDDDDTDGMDEVIPSEQEDLHLNKDSATAHDRRPIMRKAMDHAIKMAQDAAIHNQKAIRSAERFVRPWVGEIAMDAAHPADVYRSALKAMGVKGPTRSTQTHSSRSSRRSRCRPYGIGRSWSPRTLPSTAAASWSASLGAQHHDPIAGQAAALPRQWPEQGWRQSDSLNRL